MSDYNDVLKKAHMQLMLKSFKRYVAETFEHVNKVPFIFGTHHLLIIDKLEKVLRGEITKLIINIAPRYGKAIDIYTEVLTDSGFKLAKDILPNDKLLGSNGKFINIIGIFPQGVTDMYKVTFSDGSSCNVCSEHLWEVQNRDRGNPDIKRTKDLIGDLYATDGRKKWQIPIVKNSIESFGSDLVIPPYLLGCWLGDGSSYKAEFTTMDDFISNAFFKVYEEGQRTHQNSGKAYTFGIKSNFIKTLREYNLIGNKHIPDSYLFSSVSERLELLQGLMDTDGTCNKKNGQISFSTKSGQLAEGIKYLINSLGGVHRTYMKQGIYYNINFRLPDGLIPFKLERKINLLPKYNNRLKPRRFISSIEKIEDGETICFKVDSHDSLFTITRDLILTHNTALAVHQFISYGFALNPESKFIHLSYSGSLTLDNSISIKDIVNSEYYSNVFDYVNIKRGSDTKAKWDTTKGGGLYSTSTLGQITGFGAGLTDTEEDKILDEFTAYYNPNKFAGAIVIDDPLKPEDALSDNIREQVNRRFETTIRNRVNSRKTPIVIIMQRLHERDLCGYLQEIEPNEWTVLSIPCLRIENGKEVALWEHKHTVDELRKIESASSFVFETQYMQNPTPLEGLMYRGFKTYDVLPIENGTRKNYTDTADTGNDYLCSICYIEYDFGLYVLDVLYTKKPMEFTEVETAKMLDRNNIEISNIESNSGGRGFARNVERNLRELGNYKTTVSTFTQTDNKQVRIFTRSSEVQNMIIFPTDWQRRWPEFSRDIISFRKEGRNNNDDAPDTLTGMIEFINKHNGIDEQQLLRDFR